MRLLGTNNIQLLSSKKNVMMIKWFLIYHTDVEPKTVQLI